MREIPVHSPPKHQALMLAIEKMVRQEHLRLFLEALATAPDPELLDIKAICHEARVLLEHLP